ncbi:MAG: pyruvoyl-dependent arginine decarboxylase [archaeon]
MKEVLLSKSVSMEQLIFGPRIPFHFFLTSGVGESDVTIHAGSYHLALKEAGVERCNIITYSSILPSIAIEVEKPEPESLIHGSVLETIMACSNAKQGERATAGLILGWLYDKISGEKYGGLVCEYSGNGDEAEAVSTLQKSLEEICGNGFSERYELRDVKYYIRSFIPQKKFGTAIVAICFLDYVFPMQSIKPNI